MCKYCELKQYSDYDKGNDNCRIGELKDGSQIFGVSLNRYISEDCDIHASDLVLELAVKLGSDEYNVKSKEIKIKYCPFCGEKL